MVLHNGTLLKEYSNVVDTPGDFQTLPGVILETEGSIQKLQKKGTFSLEKS